MVRVLEDGKEVMVMQVLLVDKMQIVADTLDRLFMELIDEASRELDDLDTFISCHPFFTSLCELLENLITRFCQPVPSGDYHQEWQQYIQLK
ncbi:hypothetical protein RO3G_06242 [Rhizopus delemar RA 99-880]|uniref:N-terminal Ras-GEF domain-containing protein n=1 Tax=Rhizopus delemar (strain RA 99-880 / ATCC MYA-4621 / FGSC 9543 / NRRL 43880) TaxID=246409 RepID=I1BZA7_RHIO9|nr:hypothetical protein RO3G_06242 [Rhizopus delemar RA 99-880]|eukprot:EIE81537.1 hypothetical protein RO3G_06242 [Rhizopus delemar RA 99-880]